MLHVAGVKLITGPNLHPGPSFVGLHIGFTSKRNTIHFTPGRNKKIPFPVQFFLKKRDFINKTLAIKVITLLEIKNDWVNVTKKKKQLATLMAAFNMYLTSSLLILQL